MQNKKRNSKNKGITLMALILTIVVLVILATITIQEVSGDGIFSKAKESARKTDVAETIEKIKLEMLNNIMEKEENKKTEETIIKEYAKDGLIYYNQNDEGYILTAKGNEVLISEITGKESKATNYIDGNYSYVRKVNSPKLANGMKAVYWDENGNEILQGDANFNIQNWYNYEAQTGATTNGGTSKWANAKTEDGSYWVWIPRYEYKIIYYTDNTYTTQNKDNAFTKYGEIDVKFIPTSQTTASQGYIIHPAFQDGSKNEIPYGNGEWDAEISGIWVAKYEMSRETSSDSGTTWNTASGTNAVAVKNTSRAVSKPSVSSWRNITIGNMYTTCQEYDNNLGLGDNLNSHLMKNSEWGAVAYLTHSKYGRNGTEVSINNCESYIAGAGTYSTTYTVKSDGTMTEEIFKEDYAYNTTNGKLASSTGNIYGIYDLSGGAWERTAAYVSNGNGNLSYGSSFIDEERKVANPEGYKTLSTKYATVYPYFESDADTPRTTLADNSGDNYNAYRNLRESKSNYGYGDALAETAGWNSDYAYFAASSYPFFERGGKYNNGASAGVFWSSNYAGSASGAYGFRAVLVVE